MKSGILVVLALSAIPFAPVMLEAQTITGGLTLSLTRQDSEGTDVDSRGLDGRMETDFGNGFTFGLEVGASRMSQDGVAMDIDAEFIALDGGYRFSNGVRAGLFADRLTFSFGAPIDVTLKTNGLTLGYEGSGFDAEAFVAHTSLSIPLPFDIDNYGITARYSGMAGLELGAALLRAELSAGGPSQDIDFKGIAATYVMNDSTMLFGGVTKTDLFGTADIDTAGIGIGYDLGVMTGFSATVSLEAARTDLTTSDIDTLRLGLTLPLGKKGPMLPMNSVADSVLNARHGALNAALTSAF